MYTMKLYVLTPFHTGAHCLPISNERTNIDSLEPCDSDLLTAAAPEQEESIPGMSMVGPAVDYSC
jgi:hypothetical protein